MLSRKIPRGQPPLMLLILCTCSLSPFCIEGYSGKRQRYIHSERYEGRGPLRRSLYIRRDKNKYDCVDGNAKSLHVLLNGKGN